MAEQSIGALAGAEEEVARLRIHQHTARGSLEAPLIEKAASRVETAASTEAAVDLAIAACDGEPRAAIRALIVLAAHF